MPAPLVPQIPAPGEVRTHLQAVAGSGQGTRLSGVTHTALRRGEHSLLACNWNGRMGSSTVFRTASSAVHILRSGLGTVLNPTPRGDVTGRWGGGRAEEERPDMGRSWRVAEQLYKTRAAAAR